MDIIVKSNDDSYFYLYKIIKNKYAVKYTDVINENINKLIFDKLDNLGYIKDTNILLEDIIKSNKINKIFVEEETTKLIKIVEKYKINYKILNKNNLFIEEINKLKSVILLKYILDENKQSIFNLKILVLGDNNIANTIIVLFKKLNSFCDLYNYDLIDSNIPLYKYDIIINTANFTINPDLLFNVKKSLIIYDLNPYSTKLDKNLISNNFIKYRFISNVSLYFPMAKANILESMCEYDSL